MLANYMVMHMLRTLMMPSDSKCHDPDLSTGHGLLADVMASLLRYSELECLHTCGATFTW